MQPVKSGTDRTPIVIGRLSGVYGVKGWLKVHSYTKPRAGILDYQHWLLSRDGLDWQPKTLQAGKQHGKGIIVSFSGLADRDEAAALVGADIAIYRDAFAPLDEGEYYWADLIGLRVVNVNGVELGMIKSLIETGANDVLVVNGDRERLIPYVIGQFIKHVDLDARQVLVDWDAEY